MARDAGKGPFAATPVVIVALVVFVLVDTALVWWALASVGRNAGSPAAETMPTLPARETAAADSTVPATTMPAAATAAVVPSARYLYAVDGATAFRGTRGSCPSVGASFESTTDGGATWATGATEFTDARAVAQAPEDPIVVIARDAATCAVTAYWTFVGGIDWEPAAEFQPTWIADGGRAIAPGGLATTPCRDGVADLAGRNDSEAVVLCEDGLLLTTADAGVTWVAVDPVADAVAVAAGTDAFLVAVAGSPDCDGVRVIAAGGGAIGECVAVAVAPGETAIDVAGDGTVWVWAGDAIARSADGGATW
ncbi:hypothetical protein [Agromyces sp. LHK192]|uniref:hypothetical protein n=1 Tax=Agromyces sp. LHK192 TaxID=2498704 RepID=UPI000FDCB9E7|nr:hypothetical protein [Agromyces sp. LHK192]